MTTRKILDPAELDAGEWERAPGTALAGAVKHTVMMNMVPILHGGHSG